MNQQVRKVRNKIFKCTGLLFFVAFSSCTAQIQYDLLSSRKETEVENLNRKNSDMVYGEVITTPQGYQFTGVFGETTEKSGSLNNNQWKFEGVFYE